MPILDFKGKSVIYSHHLRVPFRSLNIDKKRSFSSPKSNGKKSEPSLDNNLIIHGDNLHALKALIPKYHGRIKCIYIDPPYNTGNEGWIYNDKVNNPIIKEWLKQNGIGKDDLERHDKWLCMMWPRLQLLKELLSEDGVIFVSIDDNEQFRLMAIMEEIFGEENFIGGFVWRKKAGAGADSKLFFRQHEHILFYGKNVKNLTNLFQPLTEKQKKEYKNPDNDPRGLWASTDLTRTDDNDPKRTYEVISPCGKKYKNCWTYTEEKFYKLIDENLIWWGKNEDQKPKRKRFFNNKKGLIPRSWIDSFLTSDGKKDLESINFNCFQYPKPKKLIKLLLQIASDKNSIILDSFAGSGTTAHAVLDLNKEDGGNRKFILVECEDYADTITAERVRRVIKGVPKAKEGRLKKGLGGSFTYCTLGKEINTENLLKGKDLPDYKQLAEYVFYTATGESLSKVYKANSAWFIGESSAYRLHLVYKPDLDFLRSKDSALHEGLAETIKNFNEQSKKISLVFAPAKYITQKELLKDYGIQFCQLPYDIHKIMGA